MRRARLEAAALSALIVLGALLERRQHGVEQAYLAFVLVLSGTLFRRFLLGAVPGPLLALETLAFSGLAVYPLHACAHELTGAATALVALGWTGPRVERRATALEEGLVLALAALALVLAAPRPTSPALGLLALVAVEAWRPGAPRAAEDAARRGARFALVAGLAELEGAGHGARDVLLLLALVAALGAFVEARPARATRALVALALLAPLAWLRALALALLLARGLARPLRLALAPSSVRLCALVLGAATFTLAAACRHCGRPALEVLDLAILAGALALFGVASARPLEASAPEPGPAWPVHAAALVPLALHAVALGGPIGWKGDESFHVFRALRAQELLSHALGPGLLAAAAILLVVRSRAAAVIAAVVVASLAGVAGLGPDGNLVFNRYALLETWGHAALAFAPGALVPALRLDEGWFRLLPLLATIAAACAVARFAPFGPVQRLLAALALVTLPTLAHHATVLYLEVPLVLAMLLVLAAHAREPLPTGPAFLALLAIPFAKETAAPFAAVIGARYALVLLRHPRAVLRWLVVLGVPVALGLYLRLPGFRPYRSDLAPLATPVVLVHLARALAPQLGPALLLAPLGALLACRRGRWDHAALCLALLAAYAAFIAFDGPAVPLADGSAVSLWWGNARFSLLFLAPIVALAGEVVAAPPAAVRALVLAFALTANVLLWPVALSGARPAFWGDCLAPSELFYPYDRALALVPREPGARVLILGSCADYLFELYHERLGAGFQVEQRPWAPASLDARFGERVRDWPLPRDLPVDASEAPLRAALEREAAAGGAAAMIVHLLPGDVSDWPRERGAYRLEGDVRLGETRLLVYVRRDRGGHDG